MQIKKDIKNIICRFRDDDIPALGAQLSYSLLLSFFPFLIFLMTVVGYSSIRSEDVLFSLKNLLPDSAFDLIHSTVVEIVDSKNGHLLSFSIIITIWTASSGFNAVIKGLNKAYDEVEKRPYWKVQLVSVLCTIGVAVIIVATFLLLVFGQLIGNIFVRHLGFPIAVKNIWNVLRYVVLLFSMIFIFAAVYHYTPSRRLTWKEVLPGAIFSTVGWVVTSIGFSYYVNHFANYSKVYGSIGAVIILLTWLFLSSTIILLGGELNATLAFDREGKEKPEGKKY